MYLIKYIFTLTLLFQLYESKSYSGRKPIYIALSKNLDPDIASFLGDELDKIITKTGMDFPSKEAAADELLNSNSTRAFTLRKKLQKRKSYANSGVHVNGGGFLCDRRFCNDLGNGHHAIGVCSPHHCLCKKKEPHPGKCWMKRIFDPMEKKCVDTSILCGSY